jgi:CDP-paratose 2-epimerase
MLEAIELCREISGRELDYELSDQARMGDHRWWVSDLSEFQRDYPGFELTYGIEDVLREIHDANVEQWSTEAAAAG